MAEKHTTLAQLRKLALRSKVEFLNLLVEAMEGVQAGITVTLPAADWEDGVQIIQNESLLADNNYWYLVSPDASCFAESSGKGVRADNITEDGKITFRCDTAPKSDLTMNIIRLEVEA